MSNMTARDWAIAYDLAFGRKQFYTSGLVEGEEEFLNKLNKDDPQGLFVVELRRLEMNKAEMGPTCVGVMESVQVMIAAIETATPPELREVMTKCNVLSVDHAVPASERWKYRELARLIRQSIGSK